jgi:stress response protein SCP2
MEVINLQKGQTVDLRKNKAGADVYDLSSVTIGLGWDIKSNKQGFWDMLMGRGSEMEESKFEYDLDAVAFCLNDKNKIENLGFDGKHGKSDVPYQKGDIIYFNNLTAPSGNIGAYQNLTKREIELKIKQFVANGEYIIHTGDNLTGEGAGDDEQIIIRLDSLPARIHKIVFAVSIYQGILRNQHFGKLQNAFIRAVDAKKREIARYKLSSEAALHGHCSLIFAEVYRRGDDWKFRALGEPHETDSFPRLMEKYF